MARMKKRREIHHEPNTHEILICLESMPKWVDILIQHSEKSFCHFLKWFTSNNFYKDRNNKLTIKQLSKDYGLAEASKITKWISEAYNEILLLHIEKPELFKGIGIKVNCYCSRFDDSASIILWFQVVPKMYEEVRIEFLKGRLGIEYFWVESVSHDITNDGIEITLFLKGGFPNQYRHLLLQRAQFEGILSFQEILFNTDNENDKELLEYYRR